MEKDHVMSQISTLLQTERLGSTIIHSIADMALNQIQFSSEIVNLFCSQIRSRPRPELLYIIDAILKKSLQKKNQQFFQQFSPVINRCLSYVRNSPLTPREIESVSKLTDIWKKKLFHNLEITEPVTPIPQQTPREAIKRPRPEEPPTPPKIMSQQSPLPNFPKKTPPPQPSPLLQKKITPSPPKRIRLTRTTITALPLDLMELILSLVSIPTLISFSYTSKVCKASVFRKNLWTSLSPNRFNEHPHTEIQRPIFLMMFNWIFNQPSIPQFVRYIDFSYIQHISNSFLEKIQDQCHSLKTLNLSGSLTITNDIIKICPAFIDIETLILKSVLQIDRTAIRSLSHFCPSLSYLDISHLRLKSTVVHSLLKNCKTLKTLICHCLHFDSFSTLTTVKKKKTNLENIDCSCYCWQAKLNAEQINDDYIKKLLDIHPKLKTFKAPGYSWNEKGFKGQVLVTRFHFYVPKAGDERDLLELVSGDLKDGILHNLDHTAELFLSNSFLSNTKFPIPMVRDENGNPLIHKSIETKNYEQIYLFLDHSSLFDNVWSLDSKGHPPLLRCKDFDLVRYIMAHPNYEGPSHPAEVLLCSMAEICLKPVPKITVDDVSQMLQFLESSESTPISAVVNSKFGSILLERQETVEKLIANPDVDTRALVNRTLNVDGFLKTVTGGCSRTIIQAILRSLGQHFSTGFPQVRRAEAINTFLERDKYRK